jgi:hypothetical protein
MKVEGTPDSRQIETDAFSRAPHMLVGVPIQCHHSSKRLLYTSVGDTCKNTIGGTQ